MDGDRFSVSLKFSRPVGVTAVVTAYLFGYRPDVPFSRMPKLRLQFSGTKSSLYDQGKEITDPALEVKASSSRADVLVAARVAGQPAMVVCERADPHLGSPDGLDRLADDCFARLVDRRRAS